MAALKAVLDGGWQEGWRQAARARVPPAEEPEIVKFVGSA